MILPSCPVVLDAIQGLVPPAGVVAWSQEEMARYITAAIIDHGHARTGLYIGLGDEGRHPIAQLTFRTCECDQPEAAT